MPAQVEGPFDYTATGVLGEQRNTMLRNELHLRNKLGHVKSRGLELPGASFVYGTPSDRRDFTVANALRGWAGILPKKQTAPAARPALERDFKNLNKGAVTDGLVKASENYDYRATHDIRQSPFKSQKVPSKMSRRLPPTTVFGAPSRPSTPIFELLEHKYQDRWFTERQKQLEAKRSAEAKRRVMSAPTYRGQRIVYETRASLLRTYQNPVEPTPLWQLSRFAKSARPHIRTFRTDSAKSGAFRNLESDKIARKGEFGTGIYEAAKY